MIQLAIKYAVTAALVIAIAELGKCSSWLGATHSSRAWQLVTAALLVCMLVTASALFIGKVLNAKQQPR